jgi:hypothetical protein
VRFKLRTFLEDLNPCCPWINNATTPHTSSPSYAQVRGVPAWFAGLVWMEIFVQIPLMLFLLWAYATRSKALRVAALVYSAHVLTTMVPILVHFHTSMKPPHRWCVMAVYSPWVIIPAMMGIRFLLVPGQVKQGHRSMSKKAR